MSGSGLEVEDITTPEGLEGLRAEWSELWERCPSASPFLTPEWLVPWYRRLAAPNPLWVLAWRCAGRLVGVAPLFLHVWQGRRQVSLLGTGITDCLDVLLEPGAEAEGAQALFARLAEDRSRWEVCDLEQLSPDSPLLAAAPEGLTANVTDHDTRLVVPLPATAEEYLGSLSYLQRRNVRNTSRRAAKACAVEYATATAADLPEAMNTLIRLHTARWEGQGMPGMVAAPRLQAFYREAAAGLLARGRLVLLTLRFNGRPAAAMYCLVGHGRWCFYLNGFEPAFGDLSPGLLLLYHAIEQAIREGAREVDMLRGQEPYKYRWGVREVVNRRLVLRCAPALTPNPSP